MKLLNTLVSDKERVKTGLFLIAFVAIVGIVDSFWLTWAFLGAVFLVGFYEAMKLFGVDNSSWLCLYAGIVWIGGAFYPQPVDLIFVALAILASMLAYKGELEQKLFLPLLYPGISLLFMLSLYNEFGMIAFVWLILSVSGTDIAAYMVGKSFGKTKFCQTSPNKTLEGVAGGIAIGTLLGSFVGLYFTSFFYAIAVSFFVSGFSVFGDLFESYLKRKVGVKDSGNILPGHGGILDRIDGYLFGAVILVILLRFISN